MKLYVSCYSVRQFHISKEWTERGCHVEFRYN